MTLVKVGVYCLRGGGHWACYDDLDANTCGTKGPDVYIDLDREDYQMYPGWLQRIMDEELNRGHWRRLTSANPPHYTKSP